LGVQFEQEYGDDIRRLLVLYLWDLGLIFFRFDPDKAPEILSVHKLELYENTFSDLWIELLSGLIAKYINGVSKGKVQESFLAYLAGTIRNILIENAQSIGLFPKDSTNRALRTFCKAKKDSTRKYHMARIKYRLWYTVENELLSCCPGDCFSDVYRNVYHVVDYFFEEYIPKKCSTVENSNDRRILNRLASLFSKKDYKQALTFVGSVTPFLPDATVTVSTDSADGRLDGEIMSMLALRMERSSS
jgi:hypothetical protein